MKQIADGDESHSVYMDFKDQYNEFLLPSAVVYKVYNETEEVVILDTTALTPAKRIEVNLTGDLVTMTDSTNPLELIRICVTATDSNADSIPRCFEYELIPSTECDCG